MSLFEVVGSIEDIEIIAVGSKIRDLEWLRKTYSSGRWRKLKGFARVRFLDDGEEFRADETGRAGAGNVAFSQSTLTTCPPCWGLSPRVTGRG